MIDADEHHVVRVVDDEANDIALDCGLYRGYDGVIYLDVTVVGVPTNAGVGPVSRNPLPRPSSLPSCQLRSNQSPLR